MAFHPPSGLGLRLRSESSRFDMKLKGISPIVFLARVYGLDEAGKVVGVADDSQVARGLSRVGQAMWPPVIAETEEVGRIQNLDRQKLPLFSRIETQERVEQKMNLETLQMEATTETVEVLVQPVGRGPATMSFRGELDVRDVDDMFRRLARVSVQLEEHGLTHERNGDVLLRLNDFPIDSPDKALQSFIALKGQNRLKLDLLRDGQPVTFNYDIR